MYKYTTYNYTKCPVKPGLDELENPRLKPFFPSICICWRFLFPTLNLPGIEQWMLYLKGDQTQDKIARSRVWNYKGFVLGDLEIPRLTWSSPKILQWSSWNSFLSFILYVKQKVVLNSTPGLSLELKAQSIPFQTRSLSSCYQDHHI